MSLITAIAASSRRPTFPAGPPSASSRGHYLLRVAVVLVLLLVLAPVLLAGVGTPPAGAAQLEARTRTSAAASFAVPVSAGAHPAKPAATVAANEAEQQARYAQARAQQAVDAGKAGDKKAAEAHAAKARAFAEQTRKRVAKVLSLTTRDSAPAKRALAAEQRADAAAARASNAARKIPIRPNPLTTPPAPPLPPSHKQAETPTSHPSRDELPREAPMPQPPQPRQQDWVDVMLEMAKRNAEEEARRPIPLDDCDNSSPDAFASCIEGVTRYNNNLRAEEIHRRILADEHPVTMEDLRQTTRELAAAPGTLNQEAKRLCTYVEIPDGVYGVIGLGWVQRYAPWLTDVVKKTGGPVAVADATCFVHEQGNGIFSPGPPDVVLAPGPLTP